MNRVHAGRFCRRHARAHAHGRGRIGEPANRAELLRKLALAQTQLRGTLQQRYYDASQRLDCSLPGPLRHPQQKLDEQKTRLAALQQNLRALPCKTSTVSAHKSSCSGDKSSAHLRPDTAAVGRDFAAFQTALQAETGRLYSICAARLGKTGCMLEAVSQQHILARGFSVVKNSRGQVIRNADSLKQGRKAAYQSLPRAKPMCA